MASRREAQDATARVRSSQDYGSSLPSRSIFLLPDGQPRGGGNAVGTGRSALSQAAGRSSVSSATELYSESRSIPLPAGAVVGTDTPGNAGPRSTGGRSHASSQGVRPAQPAAATSNGGSDDAEPFARLRRAVADYVGDEEDGPRGRGGGGAWMDPGMLDPAASDPASLDLVDSPMAPPRPLGDTRGSMMNDTLASADIMARMRQEEQELAEFEALERELQQPTHGDADPRASLESFGAPPPSIRSSYGDTNSWGTMGWSRKDEEGKSGAVDSRDPLADPDEPAPSRRGPARLSQSTGARNSGRPRTGSGSDSGGRYSHTTATSQGPPHARDTGSQRGRGAAHGSAPAADDAPVSSLVSRMFHSQRAPSSRRPASTGSGGRATNAGSKQHQQRRPPRTAAPRAGGEGGADRVGGAQAAASSASLDEVVQARVKELEKEVEQYKSEKRKLGRERAAFIREMEQQREAFEEEKKRHAKELAEERRQLEQQLKSERRVMQRQAKASAMASTNLRKERAVIDGLKAEIAKMKVDENARTSKRKVTVSRLNQRIKSLTEQNEELKQQVEFLEQQRLEQQWDDADNGGATAEAVHDRPVAKSRYHARGIASATTKPRGGRRSSRGSSDGGFRDHDSYGDQDTDARDSARPSRQHNDEDEPRYSRAHATTLPPTTQGQHASGPRHAIGGGSTASLASDDGSFHDGGGSMDAFGVVQSTAQSRGDAHGRDTGGGVAQRGDHGGGGGYNPARYGVDDEYRLSPSGAGTRPSSSSIKAHTTPRGESASSAGPAPAPVVAASPLAGVTQIPGYGKVVVSRREFGEGKTETVYTDGTRLFTYRNNTTRELTPEGHIIVRFHNGDIRKTHTDTGVEVYYFAEAKTTHTSFPDGSQLYEFPNGQVERHFPDSSKEIKYPDGTVKEVLPSGEMRSLFPDGTKLSEMPDGRKIIYGVDGSVQSEMMSPAAAGVPGGPGGARP